MKRTMPDMVNLPAVLESAQNTLRIDISSIIRAPIIDGQPTLQACWGAEVHEMPSKQWVTQNSTGKRVFRAPQPTYLGTFVTSKDQTPADLLRQLAEIYEQGKIDVSK